MSGPDSRGRADAAAGDASLRLAQRRRRMRRLALQALFVAAVLALLAVFAHNVSVNLQMRQIRSGFGFLADRAGFDIGESLLPYDAASTYAQALLIGILNTVRVALLALVAATVLGVMIGLARLSRHPLVRALALGWVELARNIPLLLQLLALYMVVTQFLPDATEAWSLGSVALLSKQGLMLGAPTALGTALLAGLAAGAALAVGGVRLVRRREGGLFAAATAGLAGLAAGLALGWIGAGLVGGWSRPALEGFSVVGGAALTPEFLTLWIGLSFFASGAIAEIVRAGAQAVPQGQWQAARALGLQEREIVQRIVFPQALRLAIPPLASQYMNLVKNSSLAVVIGYPDVVSITNTAINQNGQALECVAIVMAVYLLLNLLTAWLMNAVNARVTRAPR